MSETAPKTILIVIRHSPYGSSLAKAAVDAALATAAFDQTVDLLFIGDGVLQLMSDQDPHKPGSKNLGRQLASLPLYDINQIYIDKDAATHYNLDLAKVVVDTRPLDGPEMHQLMMKHDHLLGF